MKMESLQIERPWDYCTDATFELRKSCRLARNRTGWRKSMQEPFTLLLPSIPSTTIRRATTGHGRFAKVAEDPLVCPHPGDRPFAQNADQGEKRAGEATLAKSETHY